jgi:hypothetical protein
MPQHLAARVLQSFLNRHDGSVRPHLISSSAGNRCTRISASKFQVLTAWLLYLALSLLLFGVHLIRHLSDNYMGGGTDPICHIWAIAWWPYAIIHGLNPLITHALWAPTGYNLVWATAIPGPSLLVYPITKVFGPVVSYNLLCLAAAPAAASSAFLLCRYICRRYWPALFGGYVFGFSPYILCHMLAHLVLLLVFPIPLLILLVLRRTDGELGRRTFVAVLIGILLFQFLSSTEIFATATIFGAMVFMLALALAETQSRLKLIGVAVEIASAYTLLVLLLAPYFYYVFVPGLPIPPNPAAMYSNDLLTFVLPPPVLLLGPQLIGPAAAHFFSGRTWWEQTGYFGPGLWILILLFAWTFWRTKTGKLLILSFIVIAVMSVGPKLNVGGKSLVIMPWWLFSQLPLIDEALPGRFGIYLFLIVAVGAAIYLSRIDVRPWQKILLAGLALAFIMPRPAIWQQSERVPAFLNTPGVTSFKVPAFFRCAEYKRYLDPGDNVVFLPLDGGGSNSGMLWQAQSDFYFNTTDWFGAIPPLDAPRWPIIAAFQQGFEIFDFSEQLQGFLGAHRVRAIIVDAGAAGRWPQILAKADMHGIYRGGIIFYDVAKAIPRSLHQTTAHQLAERYAAVAFATLLNGANRYVAAQLPLNRLTPGELYHLKMLELPDPTLTQLDSKWWQNLWLGSHSDLIGVGIVGNFEDLRFLIARYGPYAVHIYFPFPKPVSKRSAKGNGLLLMTFSKEGIRQAAVRTKDVEVQ